MYFHGMKRIVLLLALYMLQMAAISQSKLVYQFDIKDEIGPPTWRITKLAIEEAHELNADLIFISMNTYGGAVDAADSIRTKVLNSDIPVFVLIENNAASAGALISLACDSIFMQAGSTIGAATVVNQTGEQMPDKYQSYMRKKMRATAEENGRNPDIAEAMVDPDKEVEGVSEKGKVVTLTVKEAIELGFCDGQFSSMDEVLNSVEFGEYTVVKQELSSTDKIIGWLINPAISGVLILIIFGGIYFELQSPGIGFPIIASILAAIVYFAPLYIEGLAENWEVIVFAVGIALIAVEVFVIPGFGIAGISGIALAITGLTLSLIGNVGFDFRPVELSSVYQALLVVVLSSSLSVGASILLASRLAKTHAFSRLVLDATQSSDAGYVGTSTEEFDLIGQTGTTHTELMPAGKVEIDSRLYDAMAETGYIAKGEQVKVVDYSTAQIKVRPVAS